MRTSGVIATILAALTVGIASAKSYNFTLPGTAMAGSHELKANQRYSVEVKGSEVVIKGEKDRTPVTIPVKSEQSPTKYFATAVETQEAENASGPRIVKAIQLGGSNTRLVLNP